MGGVDESSIFTRCALCGAVLCVSVYFSKHLSPLVVVVVVSLTDALHATKPQAKKKRQRWKKKKGGHQRKYPLLFLLSLLFYCYYYCVGYRGTCPSRVVFLLLLFCSTCPSALECVNHLLPLISLFFFVSSPPPSSLFFSPCAPSSFFFFASHARLSAEHVHATEFRFLRACADAA